MAVDLSGLEAVVEAQKGIVPSVRTFIQELKDALALELKDDPAANAKVQQLMADVLAANTDLSAAIQANA